MKTDQSLGVSGLARLSGVSIRTLRYYDQIGLLTPRHRDANGYRKYGREEQERLQHILSLRELDLSLRDIACYLDDPRFNRTDALRDHRSRLQARLRRLETILATLDASILAEEKQMSLSKEQRFEGFAEKLIEENELLYGEEIRQRYGEETVESSYSRIRSKSGKEQKEGEELARRQLESLYEAMETEDPGSEKAQESAELHRQFLEYWWSDYSAEYHAGMVNMYLQDPRFTEYYDKRKPGAARFLHDAVMLYLQRTFSYNSDNNGNTMGA